MRITGAIPNRYLELMNPCDRPKGPAGMLASEVATKASERTEKELQQDIGRILNQRDIPFISPVFGKKTRIKVGWPDFTFPHPNDGRLCAVEIKVGSNHPTPEQAKCIENIQKAKGIAVVVRSLPEFIQILK